MTLDEVFGQPATDVEVPPDWWSWSGAHGGLVVGLLAHHIRSAAADDHALRSLNAVLHTPVRDPLSVEVDQVHRGGSTSTWRATGSVGGRAALTTTAVLGRPGRGPAYPTAAPPPARAPRDHDLLDLPVDLVPFAQHLEIRPVSDSRPMAGGSTAELTAWVRLTDERPVTPEVVAVLVDALPPSLFATMTAPAPIPTVELSIHYGALDDAGASPWLLIRAATTSSRDGWVTEEVAAWTESGAMAARSTQLRLHLEGAAA